MSESNIINGDSALPIPRQYARWLGLNEAGILQQLHWHIEQGHGQVIDGKQWIRMSENEWMEEIPLDEKAIQRAIKNLAKDGLIESAAFVGRCKWYTICYDKVKALTGPVARITDKAQKRKAARASRKDVQSIEVKEQNVPITREQNVPQKPAKHRNKMTVAKVQNVPLQESLQESDSLLLLNAHAREIDIVLDKIGLLCKTNFFNPKIDPYKSNLLKTIREYTAVKVLWAIELALSPEKANGKAKTWGYVLGILENDKNGNHHIGATNGHNKQNNGAGYTSSTDPDKIKTISADEWAAINSG